jgi:hypothetical protein
MRSKINDYIFYKIVNINGDCDNLCYVGSTANWDRRLGCHKYNCSNENSKKYNIKLYQTIRANGGWYEFKMVQIATAEQLTQRQACALEETYRIDLKADMNSQRCFFEGTTEEYKKQYYIDNIEKLKEINKQYYIDNIEKIKEINKQYRVDNVEKTKEYQKQYYIDNAKKLKESASQYRIDNTEKIKEYKKQYAIDNVEKLKEHKKQYYIDNVEKIKESGKQYRIDNKSKINARKSEKHNCVCGGKYTTCHLSRHIETKKHQTYIKNNPIKIDNCVECV